MPARLGEWVSPSLAGTLALHSPADTMFSDFSGRATGFCSRPSRFHRLPHDLIVFFALAWFLAVI